MKGRKGRERAREGGKEERKDKEMQDEFAISQNRPTKKKFRMRMKKLKL